MAAHAAVASGLYSSFGKIVLFTSWLSFRIFFIWLPLNRVVIMRIHDSSDIQCSIISGGVSWPCESDTSLVTVVKFYFGPASDLGRQVP